MDRWEMLTWCPTPGRLVLMGRPWGAPLGQWVLVPTPEAELTQMVWYLLRALALRWCA